MKYILINEDYLSRFGNVLKQYGFIPVGLPKDERINKMVASHADTLIFADDRLIANEDYIKRLPANLHSRFTPVPDSPAGNYPEDTVFNALRVGNFLFARKSLSAYIQKYANMKGLTIVPTKQGYARCAVLPLPDKASAVTTDRGMAASMKRVGIKVLEIQPGHIALTGADCGFIGGASFVCREEKRVYFFGELSSHPDGDTISRFLFDCEYEVISLGGELTDIGGAIIIPQDGESHDRRL